MRRTLNYAAYILGPPATATYSPIKISSGLLLKDIVGGYYYKFDGSQLTTYTDMLNGAAICKACKYMLIDRSTAYCSDGGSRLFANSSIPGMIKSTYPVILKSVPQTTMLPTCIPTKTLKIDSSRRLSSRYGFMKGSSNSDLVLVNDQPSFQYQYDGANQKIYPYSYKFLNMNTFTEQEIQIEPKSWQGYPISIDYDNDYFFQDGSLYPLCCNKSSIQIPTGHISAVAIEDTTVFAVLNGLLTKIDVTNPLTSRPTISISDEWNPALAALDKDTVIYGMKDFLLIYNMTSLQTVANIDPAPAVFNICKTNDWELEALTNSKLGLLMSVTCYGKKENFYLFKVSI